MDQETIAEQLVLAGEQRKAGRYDEAQRILDMLVASAPDNAQVAYHAYERALRFYADHLDETWQ